MIILEVKVISNNDTIVAEIKALDQNLQEGDSLFCFIKRDVSHKMKLTGQFYSLLIRILQKLFPGLDKRTIYDTYFQDFEDYIKDYYFPKISIGGKDFNASLKNLSESELSQIIDKIRFDFSTKYKVEGL